MELPLLNYSTNEAPIHRLVDDVLAYIFSLNATLPDPDPRGGPRRNHATTVASSQVCMRWRSIALHCHTIWGPIIDYSRHSHKWIETLLDRSHPSLLDFGSRINTVYFFDREQDVLELVFNHIDRFRIFNFKVSWTTSWELVCSRFLQLPAPNLEFLNVDIDSNIRQSTHPLFNHHAPNLQNLQLRRCTVDFTSPILTSLTELYVQDIYDASAVPTVLDWLNILGGMPSLRWVTLIRAISSATTNVVYPTIHLAALDMLSVAGALHESVTLIEHLIAPPRYGLRLRCHSVHVGFDQRKLFAIIKKKMDSWAMNVPNRYLEAWALTNNGMLSIGNLPHLPMGWDTEAKEVHSKRHIHLLDPVMTIKLYFSNTEDAVPLFLWLFALFERTFFDTTHLVLWVRYSFDDGPEVFLPLVDSFRGFVNLKEVYLGYDSLPEFLFPLLQQSLPTSVLLPALQTIRFNSAMFRRTSNSLLQLADFLRWRREQGFPVQKINIVNSHINRRHILTHIQDTVVEIDGSCFTYSDNNEDEENNN